MRAKLILVVPLVITLALGGCGKPDLPSVGIVVVYEGPVDKYVPCIVISSLDSGRAAATLAESAECKPFTSLVATTDRQSFFEAVDKLRRSKQPAEMAGSERVRFLIIDRSGDHAEVALGVAAAINVVREYSQFTPELAQRIESEFIRRLAS
jgi:hypothetical protein